MHLYLASSSGSRDQDLSVLRKIVSLVRFFDVLKLTAVYANTTISFWGIQLTKWNTSFQNLFFSSSGFPEWGAYTVKTFSKQSPKTIFRTSALSLCLSTLTTLSTHFSATNIPTPSVFALLPIQNSLYCLPIAPKNLHPLPLHQVSWTHATPIHIHKLAGRNVGESTCKMNGWIMHCVPVEVMPEFKSV